MPYVLSFKFQNIQEERFDTVSDALASYQQLQQQFGYGLELLEARLVCNERNTFVDLSPEVTLEAVSEELESVWRWDPEDRLKIRPVLKERYQAGRKSESPERCCALAKKGPQ